MEKKKTLFSFTASLSLPVPRGSEGSGGVMRRGGGGVVGETVSFHQTFTLIGNRYHILYSTVDLCGHRGVHVP